MTLRAIPIRKSPSQQNLLMGGERDLVLFSGLITGAMVFVIHSWFSLFVGCAIWAVGLHFLRKMASSDPLMRHAYLRQLKYKNYYAARSSLTSPTYWRGK